MRNWNLSCVDENLLIDRHPSENLNGFRAEIWPDFVQICMQLNFLENIYEKKLMQETLQNYARYNSAE